MGELEVFFIALKKFSVRANMVWNFFGGSLAYLPYVLNNYFLISLLRRLIALAERLIY